MGEGGKISRLFDALLNIGSALSGGLLIAVMLVTSIKVIFRYLLHQGLVGVDQISGTMLLYIAFLGAAWVLRRDEHVTIDLLLIRLSPKVRRWLNVSNSIIGASISLVLTVYGTLEVINSWQRGILIPAEIEIPRVVNLGVIPLGSFFLWLQFVRRTRLHLRGQEAGRMNIDV
ncbi:MAG: TRAP transporter small permease [Deltaproteobacteria bacterium]|nr:TRAP transporter small permease [Deltaproteobacteria bacterium]